MLEICASLRYPHVFTRQDDVARFKPTIKRKKSVTPFNQSNLAITQAEDLSAAFNIFIVIITVNKKGEVCPHYMS